jgi:hypothetical protein
MDQANPTAEDQVAATVQTLKMTAKLPSSGITVVMSELTGRQELDAAIEAGTTETTEGRLRLVWAQAMRSLYSIDGKRFDSSEHTAESFRNLFSAKDFGFVVELYLLVNRPSEADVATFRESAKALL